MENTNNEEKVINIGDLFKYLWKNIILFAVVFAVVTAAGIVYLLAIVKPMYKSTTTFVVAVKEESGSTTNDNIDYVNSFRLIDTVAELVNQDLVLGPVAEEYGISKGSLAGMVEVYYKEMSYLISINVKNQDKVLAKNIANSLIQQLIFVTENTQGLEFLSGTVTQTSYAENGVYVSPNKMTGMLLSAAAGIGVGIVVVAIKELSATKFRNRSEIESRLSERVLGYFPDEKKNRNADEAVNSKPAVKTQLLEQDIKNYEPYNALLGNIKYSDIENPNRLIMFTSSQENELKSTVVCNLAACIAYNGSKVAIVDLDMRKPVVHKVFRVSSENGLIDLLDGKCTEKDIIKHTKYGVDIITAGKKILNPMAVIGHKALRELLQKLKEEYEYVLVDTSPVSACSDAAAIAPQCDGVVFNVAMSDVRKREAQESVKTLKNAGAKIIGINVTKGTENKIYGGYYSRYGYYSNYYAAPEAVGEAAVTDAATEGND